MDFLFSDSFLVIFKSVDNAAKVGIGIRFRKKERSRWAMLRNGCTTICPATF